MSRRLATRILLLATCGLAFAACAARQTPAVRLEPSPELVLVPPATRVPAETPALALATATAGATRAAPTSEVFLELVSPSPQAAHPFSLGVPAGDLYVPASVAVHAESGRAYVFGARLPGDAPAISTVDLRKGEVLRLTSLRATGPAHDGRVLVSPDGDRVYVVDREAATMSLFDPEAGSLGLSLEGVLDAALDSDGRTLYTSGQGLRAYDAAGLEGGRTAPLWEIAGDGFQRLALNGDVLAVARDGAEPVLLAFDAATGRPLGSASLPETAAGLAAAPDEGWAVRSGYPPRLLRFDSALKQVAEAEVPYGDGLFYDAQRRRYLVAGFAHGGGEERLIQALSAADLKPLLTRPWPSSAGPVPMGDVPGVFAAFGDDAIVGVSRSGRSRLTALDAETLAPMAHTVLGVRLTGMALDEAAKLLYVADDQDHVRVLSLPDGAVRQAWDGASPIALDPVNRRLYVNRPGGVTALDAQTGAELARYPRSGAPAPDPNRDLVYITERGVGIYDRAGRTLGRLESTFPPNTGMVPNPAAETARVNPVTGVLAVVINNGVPGSSNASYLEIYPPASDVPVRVPGYFSFVSDLEFDPAGNVYASYSSAKNIEALQRLDGTGRETGRLGGRTGSLAVDPRSNLLYAGEAGALALVDAGTMEVQDLRRLPVPAGQLLVHSGLGRLYVRPQREPRIAVLDLTELEPFDFQPVGASGLPSGLEIRALDIAGDGQDLTLYATTSTGEHYRTRVPPGGDGSDLRWERLPVGSIPAWGKLTVAPGALFRVGEGSDGADGVFRSLDGGDSWALIDAGLNDLRPDQPVVARSAVEAYFVGRTGGVRAWQPAGSSPGAGGTWRQVMAADKDYESPGQLSLAPDGSLFLQSWGRLRRSSDRGATWQDLPVPAESGSIAGFDPDYAGNRTYFSLYCASGACHVTRSRDGGQTQENVLTLPDYSPPLKLLAPDRKTTPENGARYLYMDGYPEAQLYRSLDGGATWQVADPAALQGVTSMAIAADGRLWLGGRGSVRAVDPATFAWSPTFPPPQPSAKPSAGVGATAPSPAPRESAPAPTPCQQGLPDLGCPVSGETPVSMARQPFQYGRMIWIGPAAGMSDLQNTVLVLMEAEAVQSQSGWRRFPDTWQEDQPASDPSLVAPEGLTQPVRGFGVVWRELLGGPEATIGWATGVEQGFDGLVQRYQRGWVLRLGGEQVILANVGTWRKD